MSKLTEMLKGKEVEAVVFVTISEIVQKEAERIQGDIEDLDEGEVLTFEEVCRQETLNSLSLYTDSLEDNALEKKTVSYTAQQDLEGALLDELVCDAVEDLIAIVEEINPQIDFEEVNNAVAEACQEDGEDMTVIDSSLNDLEDVTNLPIAEASMIITLERVILFLVSVSFIKADGDAVSAMQKLNAMTD